ncbi:hypothetical protein ES703_79786 [subsurface metagenome]
MKDKHFRIVIGIQDFPHDGSTDRIEVLTCPTCRSIWFHYPDLKDGFYDVICAKCGGLTDIISLLSLTFETVSQRKRKSGRNISGA